MNLTNFKSIPEFDHIRKCNKVLCKSASQIASYLRRNLAPCIELKIAIIREHEDRLV